MLKNYVLKSENQNQSNVSFYVVSPTGFKYWNAWRIYSKIDDESKKIIISGNFNCDFLKKDCVNHNIKKIIERYDIYQFQQDVGKRRRTTNYSHSYKNWRQ